MKIPRPKLNLIELALVGGLVAILAYEGGRSRVQWQLRPFLSKGSIELQALDDRFGPERHSEHGEEWILRDFFGEQRDGVFVDVGASHYQSLSNTYFLETRLGWSGLAIEPQTKFADGYTSNRPRTKFISAFVSEVSNQEATLYLPTEDSIASANLAFVRSLGGEGIQSLKVNTSSLDDILERSGITHIDFLSVDVELHEPMVLKGFSIERFQPKLVCIEAHAAVRQQILDYFAAHGYVVAGQYLRADTANIWFTRARKGA
jgi:FkbM family methyltransferase